MTDHAGKAKGQAAKRAEEEGEAEPQPRHPLHEAVLEQDLDKLKDLLYLIAHPEEVAERKRQREEERRKAKEDGEGDEEEVEEEPLDINDKDDEGSTALALAVREGNLEVLKLLLANGASFDEASEASGLTPLQEAVANGNVECVLALCKAGANVNVRDPSTGTPPLWDAVSNSQTEATRILIEHGADVFCESPEGETLLFVAVANDEMALASLLLKQGVDINRQNLEGFSALHVAAYSNQVAMLKFLLESTNAGQVSLFLKNEQGNTPRMEAEASGSDECAEILRKYEAAEIHKRNMKNPYHSPDGKDHFSMLDQSVILRIFDKLSDPKDLCAIERVCKSWSLLCSDVTIRGDKGDKEKEGEKEESGGIWRKLYMAWFGGQGDRAEAKKPSGVVYGQGRPFFAVKVFMEGSWKNCFEERFFINSCDPCTNHKIDLFLRVHFIAGNRGSIAATKELQNLLMFDEGTFEHLRYGGTALYAARKRILLSPTPFKRSESSPEELPTPDAPPHLVVICVDLSRPAAVDAKIDGFMAQCPRLLVGVRESLQGSDEVVDKTMSAACKKYECDFVECSLAQRQGVHQIFACAVRSCNNNNSGKQH